MQIHSFYQDHIQPLKITVELSTRFQIPSFQILGLPAPEIQEARERIMAAFSACEFEFPKKKVIINLAPSSVRKSGTGHDLSIALQVLNSALELDWKEDLYAWGELGLNGEIKACGKMALLIELLLQAGSAQKRLVLSVEDAQQFLKLLQWRRSKFLNVPENFKLHALCSLREIPDLLSKAPLQELEVEKKKIEPIVSTAALLSIPRSLERLIEIALTGRHHTLILGPKGIGKSQALHWFHYLVPESDPEQTWARLLHEESRSNQFTFQTPVRRVHSQIKPSHLTGSWGPKGFRAGELTLAHGGLLIADEFMEWPRDAKECLREPLQNKSVIVTRVHGQTQFACDLQLIGTGNLCPCGGLPPQFASLVETQFRKTFRCRCRAAEVDDYFFKLSGPIADRIDLISLFTRSAEASTRKSDPLEIKNRILEARAFSLRNFGTLPGDLKVEWLEGKVRESLEIQFLLKTLGSLRSRHKILRVAHSIQALEKSSQLKKEHVFEAMAYRSLESGWMS